MKRYAVYDRATGEILKVVLAAPHRAKRHESAHTGIIETPHSDATHIVRAGEVVPKPHIQPQHPERFTGTVSVRGLPPRCRVRITGPAAPAIVDVDDGILEIEAEYPGTYTITAEAPLHLPTTFSMVAE